ncbi:MAG: hypothetical protein QXX56_01905 [Candidatus Bathyarchaeia archaeon]
MEEAKLKKIAELREILEERIKSLEAEIEGLRIILEFVNNLLLEKSFKRAEEMIPTKVSEVVAPIAQPQIMESSRIIPLKTSSGELLANIYVEDRNLRVVPETGKKFDVNVPPFEAFLVEKVLNKMRELDQEAVRKGELTPEEAISYEVKKDGSIIKEIFIQNVTPQRERELRSAIRWTLEKMYEKIKSSS